MHPKPLGIDPKLPGIDPKLLGSAPKLPGIDPELFGMHPRPRRRLSAAPRTPSHPSPAATKYSFFPAGVCRSGRPRAQVISRKPGPPAPPQGV
jgi:hypothetical protein